jgi:hypothetical protein
MNESQKGESMGERAKPNDVTGLPLALRTEATGSGVYGMYAQ